MKDAEYYMDLPYRMEIVKADNEAGYTVSFPELRGCLTSGMTIQDAVRNAEDAKRSWFQIRIPKELHRKLYMHSRDSGVSMNQYCTMLLSMNDNAIHEYRYRKQ